MKNSGTFNFDAMHRYTVPVSLINLLKQPTSFKCDTSTHVDVFLTKRPECLSGVISADIKASDIHNGTFAPFQIRRKIPDRSTENCQRDGFRADFIKSPFMPKTFSFSSTIYTGRKIKCF